MKNPLDKYAGIHIISAEKVSQSFIEETGSLKVSFNVFLARAFVGALCFQKNMIWQCYFFDDIKKEDYIQDSIESVINLFTHDPEYKCCIFFVSEETIDKVTKSTILALNVNHLNVNCIVQNQEALSILKDKVEKYTGSPLYSRYGVYQFIFEYMIYTDDDNQYGDSQAHILIESCDFLPVWSFLDSEAFQAALRHPIISEGEEIDYKDPPHYR